MNVLMTHHFREHVDVLSRVAIEVHVADNGTRESGRALPENVFLVHLLEGETTSSVREIAQYLVEKRIDVIYA